jgi:3-oxoacyl-(acyl-carrier-protein) synthase
MPYSVTSEATGASFICKTVAETIERATDLISQGIQDVCITNDRDQRFTPTEFYNSACWPGRSRRLP